MLRKARSLAYIVAAFTASYVLLSIGATITSGAGSDLDHPRVRIQDPDGLPMEGVTVTALVNGTTYSEVTGGSGWAVFRGIDNVTFPSGTAFSASKQGYRTIQWSQGDPIPSMVVAREDDTLLVVFLIALTVISVLVLLALSFREKIFGKVG